MTALLAAASLAHSSLWWVGPLAFVAVVLGPPCAIILCACRKSDRADSIPTHTPNPS